METRGSLPFRVVAEPFIQTHSGDHPQHLNENHAGDKTADMGPPGHATDITGSEASRDDLNKEPVSEEDKSRYFEDLEKEDDGDQCQDPRAGVEKEIATHDTGNGPARPDRWDLGIPVREKMDKTRRYSAKDVKHKVPDVAEVILHVIAEDIKKPHIPQDMEEAAVEKHGGQKRKKLLERREVNGHIRIGVSKRKNPVEIKGFLQAIPLGELPQEGDNIQTDDQGIDHGEVPGPHRISKWNHLLSPLPLSDCLCLYNFWSFHSNPGTLAPLNPILGVIFK